MGLPYSPNSGILQQISRGAVMQYASILTVNRLRLMVHLGFYERERSVPQPIEISMRLYFPETPACAKDDHAKFLDYASLSASISEWATSQQFRLVEYMGMQAFNHVRAYLDAHHYENVKLWLQLVKCEAPVPNLQGGTSFIHSDVPIAATSFMPAL